MIILVRLENVCINFNLCYFMLMSHRLHKERNLIYIWMWREYIKICLTRCCELKHDPRQKIKGCSASRQMLAQLSISSLSHDQRAATRNALHLQNCIRSDEREKIFLVLLFINQAWFQFKSWPQNESLSVSCSHIDLSFAIKRSKWR